MKLSEANSISLQQALDYSLSKLVEQGERCMHDYEESVCVYGNRHGMHCAVGWLLDDTDSEVMEFEGDVYDLLDEIQHSKLPSLLVEYPDQFADFQQFHDAETKILRLKYADRLAEHGIDVSGPHWDQWIEMGACEDGR